MWGASILRKVQEIFFGRAPPLFGSESTISRFGERFCGGQYSLVNFLFAVLLLMHGAPRDQPFVKVGTRASVPHGVGVSGRTDCIICFRLPRERFF